VAITLKRGKVTGEGCRKTHANLAFTRQRVPATGDPRHYQHIDESSTHQRRINIICIPLLTIISWLVLNSNQNVKHINITDYCKLNVLKMEYYSTVIVFKSINLSNRLGYFVLLNWVRNYTLTSLLVTAAEHSVWGIVLTTL